MLKLAMSYRGKNPEKSLIKLSKIFLLATVLSIIPGQLVRISLFGEGVITVSDLLVAMTIAVFFLESIFLNVKINLPKSLFLSFSLFFLSAIASLIFSLNFYSQKEVLSGSLFLFRLCAYFFLSIVTYNLVGKNSEKWLKALIIIGFIFSLVGILQFVFFPDLSPFQEFGWDPHFMRLFSTVLDPNYAALMLTIFATGSISLFLFKRENLYILLSLFFALAIVLTFSRSGYLALAAAVVIVSALKSPKLIIIAFTTFALTFLIVPQVNDRIIGALTLDDTATARIESWQKALDIFKNNPILGVGFNNYRFAQIKYGYFDTLDASGHSGSGSDSSFLLVLATSGIIGAFFYIFFIANTLNSLRKNIDKNALAVTSFASFIALIVHSQFVNSLFFPQIMIIYWFLIGLKLASDS